MEEVEDRLQRALDESDDLRRRCERAERQAWEGRQTAEQNGKREDRLREQYERLIEGLKGELRERERDLASLEVKETFAKQDLSRDLKDRDEAVRKTVEELQLSKLQEERAREEATILRSEVA